MACLLCDYPISQNHRICPGAWGGDYTPDNVVPLCPNHHQAVHLLMRRAYRGRSIGPAEDRAVEAFRRDMPLWTLWQSRVRPVVAARMVESGRPSVADSHLITRLPARPADRT